MARNAPSTELDLIPIMNMVTILIPFLLMAASFTSIAVVPVNARPAGEPDPTTEEQEKRPSVAISPAGFLFTGTDGGVEMLPCPSGCQTATDYDLDGLRTHLSAHKDRDPKGTALELIAGDDIAYDVLIAVMDTSRADGDKDLYPDVVFGSLPRG